MKIDKGELLEKLSQPRLTSVALLMGEIDKVAMQILLDRVEGKGRGTPKKVLLGEKLIMRDSTAGPPAGDSL